MSLWDYLLPWKAIPNMVKDVKKAGDKDSHSSVVGAIGKYADPAGALLGDDWMNFWHERLPTKINEYGSGIAKKDPFIRFDRKYGLGQEGSPLRGVSDWAQNKPGDTAALVTGSILGGGALLGGWGGGAAGGAGGGAGSSMSAFGPYAGGYSFPGGGIGGMSSAGPWASGYVFPGIGGTSIGTGSMGSAAGGIGGGAASAAAPAGGSNPFDFGSMDWSDPKTYMDMYQQYGGMMPQQQQQQQQPPPGLLNPNDPEERDREYLSMLRRYGFNTHGLLG